MEGTMTRQEYMKKYKQSPEYKAYRKKYNQSSRRKASSKKYMTPELKELDALRRCWDNGV